MRSRSLLCSDCQPFDRSAPNRHWTHSPPQSPLPAIPSSALRGLPLQSTTHLAAIYMSNLVDIPQDKRQIVEVILKSTDLYKCIFVSKQATATQISKQFKKVRSPSPASLISFYSILLNRMHYKITVFMPILTFCAL